MPTTERKMAATMMALMVGATTKATKREMKPMATFRRTSTMAVISVPTMAAMSAKFHGGTGAAIPHQNREDVGLAGLGDGAGGEFPDLRSGV
jgi:hypothetical protein